MLFKARRFVTAALVLSLFIQMQFAANGYASRGTKIAFTCVGVDGNRDICVMDGDGGNEVRLTEDPARDEGPSWSPDGTRIAFTGFKALKKQIWVMDADGGNQVQLTQWGENYNPAWSPDGNRIAFVSARRHGGPEIYVMDSDGNNQVRLTHDLAEKDNPSWSPDGEWIAYDSHRNRDFQIYAVETDGGGFTKRLSRERPNNSNPAWSPDGDTIAYVTWNALMTTINLMTPEGMHLKQLTEDDGTYRSDPDWFNPVGRSVSPSGHFVTIWGKIKEPTSAPR